jgi:choline-glycine betaine transporter
MESMYIISLVVVLPLLVMIIGPILYLIKDSINEMMGLYGDNDE